MYYVKKRMEIAGSHQLDLPYKSKCSNLHGHNWIITVYVCSPKLTDYGMVTDFTHIKKCIHDKLDHQNLNTVLKHINPTAENIAMWIFNQLNFGTSGIPDNPYATCYKVEVQESEGNVACYEDSEEVIDNESC